MPHTLLRPLLAAGLCAVLCLCAACHTTPTPDATQKPLPPTPTPTAEPTPTPPANFNAVHIPGGGLDALEPYAPNQSTDRYFPEALLGMVGGNYGGFIYPYPGISFQNTRAMSLLYGICDARGKIIADPYFTDYRYIQTADGIGFYVFTRDEGILSETSLDNTRRCWVTDAQGSWAYACDDTSYPLDLRIDIINFYEPEKGLSIANSLPVCQDGKWGVLGTDGQLIVPCNFLSPPFFNEGLAPLILRKPEETPYHYVCGYINATGQRVLDEFAYQEVPLDDELPGTFLYLSMFVDGVAQRKPADDTQNAYYIDKQGNTVLELDEPNDFPPAYFIHDMLLTRNRTVYARDGSVLWSLSQPGILDIDRATDGTLYITQNDGIRVIAPGIDAFFRHAGLSDPSAPLIPLPGGGWGVCLRYPDNNICKILTLDGEVLRTEPIEAFDTLARGLTTTADGAAVAYHNLSGDLVYTLPAGVRSFALLPGNYIMVCPAANARAILRDATGRIIHEPIPDD